MQFLGFEHLAEAGRQLIDSLAQLTAAFLVETFQPGDQQGVGLFVAWVDLQRFQGLETPADFFAIQHAGVIGDHQVAPFTGLDGLRIGLQQTVGVVSEAHIDPHLSGSHGRHGNFQFAQENVFSDPTAFALIDLQQHDLCWS